MKKIIILFSIVILLQSVLIAQQTETPFRKEPYLLFQNEPDQTITYLPELKDIVIMWQLTSVETCTIKWGVEDDPISYELGSAQVNPEPGSDILYKYNFLLDDLSPQTQHYYKVIAPIDCSEDVEEFESSFITPPPNDATELTFFAYGDTRGGIGTGTDWYHSPHHEAVCEVINNEIDPDSSQTFILHAGDWNHYDTEINWDSCYFSDLDENSKIMKSKIPVMGVLGNHETFVGGGEIYKKYWPYSYHNIDEEETFNYSFDYGPVHFTIIELINEAAIINEDQENWIINDLGTDKPWKVMIFHAPGYSNGNYHANNPDAQNILQPICEQYGVQLVIAGHNHYYAHWLVNGVHHLTLGGGGVETNYPNQNIGELLAGKFHHFAKIDVDGDFMNISIIDKNGNHFEDFSLPKSLTICYGSEVTWNNDITYADLIRVCQGSTLTIKSTVGFVEDGKIIIERGGKLILDKGILTNACDGLWDGIELWGTYNQPQSLAYQGMVRLINGGTIENAVCGIRTVKMDDIPPPGGDLQPNYSYTGGIIYTVDAFFINNQTAVKFYDYTPNSFSYFKDTEFITYEDYIGSSFPQYFVDIPGMNGVKFTNCDFKNEAGEENDQYGIRSTNSYIIVKGKCLSPDLPCSEWDNGLFENLNYGIYATTSSPTKYIDVSHTDFTNNRKGVYISGMTNAEVTNNSFNINAPFCVVGGYGMYLDNSTGYEVEENNFYHEGEDATGVGLIVNQSEGEPNMIYRNWFTNLECGMDIQGENRAKDGTGLELRCNQYEGTTMDKIITWEGQFVTPFTGVAASQGSSSSNPEDMAGNLFQIDSPTPNGDFDDILNEANHITYYYPDEYDDDRVIPVDFTQSTVDLDEVEEVVWSYENGCPPSDDPGGGEIGDTKGKIAGAEQKIDSTENLLSLLIDGGNTEATQTDVDNSFPPETMQVYNELMNKSPYLSDTVVSTAIEKEDVLPGAMIRDIMVANPKAAKSKKLMSKLDERWTPLPEYMKGQILQGRSIVSIREETESRLAAFKLEKAKCFNNLVRYYLNDTVNPQASLDTLTILLQNENNLNSKYRLAMLSLERGAWS